MTVSRRALLAFAATAPVHRAKPRKPRRNDVYFNLYSNTY